MYTELQKILSGLCTIAYHTNLLLIWCSMYTSTIQMKVYVVLPKISENLLVITWILTLRPTFHCHLRSSHLGLVYNNPSGFAISGSTHLSLLALACLVPVAILLGPLQWIWNTTLSTEFHFREHIEITGGQVRWVGRVGNIGHVIFLSEIPSQRARCVQAHCHGATTSIRSSISQAVCASHFPSVISKPRSKTSQHRG